MAEATIAPSSQDEALALAAETALMNYTGVRVWSDALLFKAHNGVVEINGHVRTRAEREVTEEVILQTKGVQDVVTNLFVDTDLEIAVGKALGDDPRTRGSFPGILVGSAFGDIYLKGSVTSEEIKKAAGENRREGRRRALCHQFSPSAGTTKTCRPCQACRRSETRRRRQARSQACTKRRRRRRGTTGRVE